MLTEERRTEGESYGDLDRSVRTCTGMHTFVQACSGVHGLGPRD